MGRRRVGGGLRPDLRGDHGLLGAHGGHEVLLGQEVQRELDQETADLAQLLLGPGMVGLRQAGLGLVLLQLRHVPHQGRWKAPEHLEAAELEFLHRHTQEKSNASLLSRRLAVIRFLRCSLFMFYFCIFILGRSVVLE